mgnify:CR=1 FL=1
MKIQTRAGSIEEFKEMVQEAIYETSDILAAIESDEKE